MNMKVECLECAAMYESTESARYPFTSGVCDACDLMLRENDEYGHNRCCECADHD